MLRYTALLFVLPLTVSAQISPGSCATGTAEAALVGSGVEATLVNTGAFFFRDEEGGNFYEVDGASPMYWASVWVGGVVEGEPRVAAATYSRFEFWPGPLGEDGRPVDPDDCSAYDRIFAVTADDLAAYEAGTVPSADLADWPAALGAPVVDGDGVPGNYDLAAGDRPALRGESTAFWLMNDAGNEHENTGGSPLGVEVGVTAFAEGTDTYYRISVANKSAQPIDSLRVGFYADADLGWYGDDYLGSDSLLHLGYVYNADDFDEGSASQQGYGEAPPAIGVQMLSGAFAATRYGWHEADPIGHYCSFDPPRDPSYHALLQGLGCYGEPYAFGNWPYDPERASTTYLFTGEPESGEGWTEAGQGIAAGDRRLILAAPPKRLGVGQTRSVDVALLYARGTDHLASVTALKSKAAATLHLYGSGALFPVNVEAQAQTPTAFGLSAYPNPSAGNVTLAYRLATSRASRLVVYDALGREVARISVGTASAEMQRVRIDGQQLPAGLYVAVLEAGARREAVRFSVVR